MLALDEGRGVRETARLLKVSAAKVSEVGVCRLPRPADPQEFALRTCCYSARNRQKNGI